MENTKIKKFAQFARRSLIEQVSAKLKLVLEENSAARRENLDAVKNLEGTIEKDGSESVIERVAYTWFNRFCALRFMDVKRYNRISVVSPVPGQFQPEILADAKMGHIDEEVFDDAKRSQVTALLSGKAPSPDAQGEAYRLLVVGTCNYWHSAMPFLFERIDDYTELLMPDDLLSGNSILAYTREAMTPKACEDVEVIGWLYQFYISEKKDMVFEGLKKNKKITPENIPAATQLFTPDWIVKYLVENSLGRLWMLNHPESKLIEKMDYYIKPEHPETEYIRIKKPEEIKICDPACGSGHMLTYAFDLLYAIYQDEGYEPSEISEKILTYNLYGVEIDERAGELAAFALTMKAMQYDKRFFRRAVKRGESADSDSLKQVEPNICVLENLRFDEGELNDYMDFVGRDLFTAPLQTTLFQFEEADNFGSLIRPEVTDVESMLRILNKHDFSSDWIYKAAHQKVLQALRQADCLSPKYHVVIANPPYMGGKGMNGRLGAWIKDNYPDSKSDLFAAFMERALGLSKNQGIIAMITMHSWMFLSAYSKLRTKMLFENTILSMAHLGTRAFDSIGGEVVATTAFVVKKSRVPDLMASYVRLVFGKSETEKERLLLLSSKNRKSVFWRSSKQLAAIPSNTIAYWLPEVALKTFEHGCFLSEYLNTREGMTTGDNNRFLRFHWEVDEEKCSNENTSEYKKWCPYDKGGGFRRWYGNNEFLINWANNGEDVFGNVDLKTGRVRSHNYNGDYAFKEHLEWSRITTSRVGARYSPEGRLFDTASASGFSPDRLKFCLAIINSSVLEYFVAAFNPTIVVQVGDVLKLPLIKSSDLISKPEANAAILIDISRLDWDSYETSWNFTSLPLLSPDYRRLPIMVTYQKIRTHWREMTFDVKRLEEENNSIFIEAYGLQDELDEEVDRGEITLTCNPHYRYGGNKSENELEVSLLADTMRELVSYAVGCMFGRYALDKPGLILANQGETIEDYLKQIPEPVFSADDDNVIPMLDGDWFSDDITERFRTFLRVAFGEEHYEDNIAFVEKALGKKGKPRAIRNYFLKDFYTDHWKRYKKRPIYWMFSSSKGSFNALIYMHRYRPDTVSVLLNKYLREFKTKLLSEKSRLEGLSISASASQGEKTKALKDIEQVNKMIIEIDDYERDVIGPLAKEQVNIDLDDGVKVNYPRFGRALKKIPGLS